MDCFRDGACKSRSTMFLDFAFFVFNIKHGKKVQSCVGKQKPGFFCGEAKCWKLSHYWLCILSVETTTQKTWQFIDRSVFRRPMT